MSPETSQVEITQRHQLIDLNKKLVNFKLDFNVKSFDEKEFDAVVMCQSEINNYDKLENIEMKKAPGKIGGTIIADNNKYENYFIILKSNEPQMVEISTNIEEIPPKIEEEIVQASSIKEDFQNEKPIYRKRGFWVFLLICVLCLGFYFKDYIFQKKSVEKTVFNQEEPVKPMFDIPKTDMGTIPKTEAGNLIQEAFNGLSEGISSNSD